MNRERLQRLPTSFGSLSQEITYIKLASTKCARQRLTTLICTLLLEERDLIKRLVHLRVHYPRQESDSRNYRRTRMGKVSTSEAHNTSCSNRVFSPRERPDGSEEGHYMFQKLSPARGKSGASQVRTYVEERRIVNSGSTFGASWRTGKVDLQQA